MTLNNLLNRFVEFLYTSPNLGVKVCIEVEERTPEDLTRRVREFIREQGYTTKEGTVIGTDPHYYVDDVVQIRTRDHIVSNNRYLAATIKTTLDGLKECPYGSNPLLELTFHPSSEAEFGRLTDSFDPLTRVIVDRYFIKCYSDNNPNPDIGISHDRVVSLGGQFFTEIEKTLSIAGIKTARDLLNLDLLDILALDNPRTRTHRLLERLGVNRDVVCATSADVVDIMRHLDVPVQNLVSGTYAQMQVGNHASTLYR